MCDQRIMIKRADVEQKLAQNLRPASENGHVTLTVRKRHLPAIDPHSVLATLQGGAGLE